MKRYPSIPHLEDTPTIFERGHLWILEKVDGAHLRFQLQDSGVIRFGDRTRVFETPADVPEPYQHAVHHIQTNLEREALRRAVDDVEDIVFFGEAMHRHTLDYDWERTPSFLGFDVWAADAESFRAPDAVEGIFERLGLDPVNAVERERHTRDFDPSRYTVPQSAWYDGPAEGVVVRDKRGHRAQIRHPEFREASDSKPFAESPSELAAKYATEQRFDRLAADLEAENRAVTFDALYDRVLEDIVRQEHPRLYHDTDPVDMRAFRSAVATRLQAFIGASS
jgi:hypothetical protein